MATTGTYATLWDNEELLSEALEMAGLPVKDFGDQDNLIGARRTMTRIYSKWSNLGPRQWTFFQLEHTTTTGEVEFILPEGTIDVGAVVLRRNDQTGDPVDTVMHRISRSDYTYLVDKDHQGRPDRFYIDRRRDDAEATRPKLVYWQAADRDTDIIVVNLFRQYQDTGQPQTNPDLPFRWYHAFVMELAYQLCCKHDPRNFGLRDRLKAEAVEAFRQADAEDTDEAPVVLSVHYRR